MAFEFYLGMDLTGQDETASLALVEKAADDPDAEASYRVRRLERLQDGATDDQFASHVQDLIADAPYTGRTILVVSKAGDRGEALVEQLAGRGLSPVSVWVSGGDTAAQEGSGLTLEGGDRAGLDEGAITVSEHEVVEAVERLYRSGRLELDHEEETMSLLAQGLQSYHARAADAGEALNEIQGEPSRDADHAGLVLSTGVACWLAEQHSFDPTDHLSGSPPPVGPARRAMRGDTTDFYEAAQNDPRKVDSSTRRIDED